MPDCAAGCVRCAIVIMLVSSAACDRGGSENSYSPLRSPARGSAPVVAPPPPPPPPSPSPPAAAAPQPSAAAPNAGPELLAGTFMLQEDILRGLAHTRLHRLHPVGTTSTVFRSELD